MPCLRFAVDSVLAQSFDDWELIVVDDGSTDATSAYLDSIRDPRLRHIRIEHTGLPAKARNEGLARARGEYLAFLDSDDLWQPRKLERQLAALRARPDARWSYTDVNFIDAASALLPRDRFAETRPRSGWIVERLLAHETVVACPTVVAERRLVEEVGGFDESLPMSEDFDLWLRLAVRSPAVALRERLVDFRQHRSYSRGRPEIAACMIRIYDRFARSTRVERWRRVSRSQRAMYRVRLANVLLSRGERARAFNVLRRAIVRRPHDAAVWKAVIRFAISGRVPRRLGRMAAPLLRPIAGRESRFWRVIRSPRLRRLAFRDPIDCIVYGLLIS
ncbi:MAG: glycosyltransferase, partial [Gemmatimonadota bacterium]